MLSTVLFILCLVAVVGGVAMNHFAVRYAVYVPTAYKIAQHNSRALPALATIFIALWVVGSLDHSVPPAFTPFVMISFIGTTIILGWENLQYARGHLPATR